MRVIKSGVYNGLAVNCGGVNQYPVNEEIIENIHSRLRLMLDHYGKVMILRLDLRFPDSRCEIDHSYSIQCFMNQFSIFLKRRELGYQYVWVREQKHREHPHFHCVFIIEAGLYIESNLFVHEAQKMWARIVTESVTPGSMALVNVCRMSGAGLVAGDCFLSVRDAGYDQAFRDCFYWLSYLAKLNTKAVNPGRGKRVWGASQCNFL